jgi:DNA-binding XRE family transcriptional regulator
LLKRALKVKSENIYDRFYPDMGNSLTFWSLIVNFYHSSMKKSSMPVVNVMKHNNIRKIREERLISKAELARMAGVTPATIDRVERGEVCRVETKRKIILALGYSLAEKDEIFLD